MDEILFSYKPDTSSLEQYLVIGMLGGIVCGLAFFYAYRRKLRLLLMFSGFLSVIAFGIGAFSFVNRTKLPEVALYKEGLLSPYGKVHFSDIRRIDYEKIEQNSKFPIQKGGKPVTVDTSRIILIEEYSGKAHVISEENYPLDEIFNQLSILVRAYKAENDEK